ncbi:MAG: adenosylcobinamide-GDP ribazoletransferase [Aphanocapsa sp. GSE-SYN-MK-11-07L]|jgi:adenosylcobinamide-GDP ribazoletransferase|nr:adenosylcobinamide-GDP ribazoletransferase [Aphanocapsa sp. GSE-SYN-MK-11-07L]
MNFRWLGQIGRQGLGAIAFYTGIPIPHTWALEFTGIARWAPWVGLLIGAGLGLFNLLLSHLGVPVWPRSVLVVSLWIAITGGLHLDGAMDTADGLAVLDPARRLAVMADSRTGAFGVMAAVIIFSLKTTALISLPGTALEPLILATVWGRWAQLWAIARYPYLKPTGKGAMHKANLKLPWDLVIGSIPVLGLTVGLAIQQANALNPLSQSLVGFAIALGLSAWFNHKLGGQTGDTYGAIVEWTEALLLCCLTVPWL